MSTVVRRVSLASFLLLLGAAGSHYVGERQYKRALEELERSMYASGFYLDHAYPDTNFWEILTASLLFAGIAVATAALMLWRQEKRDSRLPHPKDREA